MSPKKCIILLIALSFMANGVFYTALADHNEHKERKRHQKRYRNSSEHDGKRHLKPVDNPKYKEICGDCHFAYQPELLPSGSWEKILAGLADHNGEEIEIGQESEKIIAEYLKANSAEHSSAKRAVKIVRSLRGQTPMRITDVPYIRHKHEDDDIPADAFTRKSVGSMSNCIACHTTAENGVYDDDHVVIPK